MKVKDSPLFYTLILTLIAFSSPFLIFLSIPDRIDIGVEVDEEVVAHTYIPIFKEKIMPDTLFFSYFLIFSYLLVHYANIFLLYVRPLRVFLPKNAKQLNEGKIFDICKKLSAKMAIKMPKVFLSEKPEVYSFGLDENNSNLLIYEKCSELNEKDLEAMLIHELGHIKSDIKYFSLRILYKGIPSGWRFPSTAGSFIAYIIVIFLFLTELLKVTYMNFESSLEGLTLYVNSFLPFAIAGACFALIIGINILLRLFTYAFRKPVSEIDEFKCDLLAYLELENVDNLFNSLNFLRRNQAIGLMRQVKTGSELPLVRRIKRLYRRIFRKGWYSKQYAGWLSYFKEDYGKLNITLGMGFDYPTDDLRKDFLRFIKRLCKEHVAFRLNREGKIDLGARWVLKSSFINGEVALVEWLQHDVSRISKANKEKVINYLINHLSDFNAKSCSVITKVSLYEVIVIVLALLVDGSLSLS